MIKKHTLKMNLTHITHFQEQNCYKLAKQFNIFVSFKLILNAEKIWNLFTFTRNLYV